MDNSLPKGNVQFLREHFNAKRFYANNKPKNVSPGNRENTCVFK